MGHKFIPDTSYRINTSFFLNQCFETSRSVSKRSMKCFQPVKTAWIHVPNSMWVRWKGKWAIGKPLSVIVTQFGIIHLVAETDLARNSTSEKHPRKPPPITLKPVPPAFYAYVISFGSKSIDSTSPGTINHRTGKTVALRIRKEDWILGYALYWNKIPWEFNGILLQWGGNWFIGYGLQNHVL